MNAVNYFDSVMEWNSKEMEWAQGEQWKVDEKQVLVSQLS